MDIFRDPSDSIKSGLPLKLPASFYPPSSLRIYDLVNLSDLSVPFRVVHDHSRHAAEKDNDCPEVCTDPGIKIVDYTPVFQGTAPVTLDGPLHVPTCTCRKKAAATPLTHGITTAFVASDAAKLGTGTTIETGIVQPTAPIVGNTVEQSKAGELCNVLASDVQSPLTASADSYDRLGSPVPLRIHVDDEMTDAGFEPVDEDSQPVSTYPLIDSRSGNGRQPRLEKAAVDYVMQLENFPSSKDCGRETPLQRIEQVDTVLSRPMEVPSAVAHQSFSAETSDALVGKSFVHVKNLPCSGCSSFQDAVVGELVDRIIKREDELSSLVDAGHIKVADLPAIEIADVPGHCRILLKQNVTLDQFAESAVSVASVQNVSSPGNRCLHDPDYLTNQEEMLNVVYSAVGDHNSDPAVALSTSTSVVPHGYEGPSPHETVSDLPGKEECGSPQNLASKTCENGVQGNNLNRSSSDSRENSQQLLSNALDASAHTVQWSHLGRSVIAIRETGLSLPADIPLPSPSSDLASSINQGQNATPSGLSACPRSNVSSDRESSDDKIKKLVSRLGSKYQDKRLIKPRKTPLTVVCSGPGKSSGVKRPGRVDSSLSPSLGGNKRVMTPSLNSKEAKDPLEPMKRTAHLPNNAGTCGTWLPQGVSNFNPRNVIVPISPFADHPFSKSPQSADRLSTAEQVSPSQRNVSQLAKVVSPAATISPRLDSFLSSHQFNYSPRSRFDSRESAESDSEIVDMEIDVFPSVEIPQPKLGGSRAVSGSSNKNTANGVSVCLSEHAAVVPVTVAASRVIGPCDGKIAPLLAVGTATLHTSAPCHSAAAKDLQSSASSNSDANLPLSTSTAVHSNISSIVRGNQSSDHRVLLGGGGPHWLTKDTFNYTPDRYNGAMQLPSFACSVSNLMRHRESTSASPVNATVSDPRQSFRECAKSVSRMFSATGQTDVLSAAAESSKSVFAVDESQNPRGRLASQTADGPPSQTGGQFYTKSDTFFQSKVLDSLLSNKLTLAHSAGIAHQEWTLETARSAERRLLFTPGDEYFTILCQLLQQYTASEIKPRLAQLNPDSVDLQRVDVIAENHHSEIYEYGLRVLPWLKIHEPHGNLQNLRQDDLIIICAQVETSHQNNVTSTEMIYELGCVDKHQTDHNGSVVVMLSSRTRLTRFKSVSVLKVCSLRVQHIQTKALFRLQGSPLRTAITKVDEECFRSLDIDSALVQHVGSHAPMLNGNQRLVVCNILQSVLHQAPKISIIHGPPGTGKYWVAVAAMKMILSKKKDKEKIIFVLPTDDAATNAVRRISKIWKKLESSPLEARLVLLDPESSRKHGTEGERPDCSMNDILDFSMSQLLRRAAPTKEDADEDRHKERLVKYQLSRDACKRHSVEYNELDKQIQLEKQELQRCTEKRLISLDSSGMREQRGKFAKCVVAGKDIIVVSVQHIAKTETQDVLHELQISCMFIHEAGRLTELDTLVALMSLRDRLQKAIIIGCQFEIPISTEDGTEVRRLELSRSMLERMWTYLKLERGCTVGLSTQYQIDSRIGIFPFTEFYNKRIIDDKSTDTLQKDWKFHPYKVFDFHHSLADESNFVAVLLKQLMNVHSNQSSYTILTRSGRDCRRIDRIRNENKWNIRIRPAASYQGKECDVVIYSTFGEPIKKVWEDLERRRLFVAMTAACRTLIILSHLPSLKGCDTWSELIRCAQNERLCVSVPASQNVREMENLVRRELVKNPSRFLIP